MKSKKILSLILTMAVGTSLFTGCGGNDNSQTANTTASTAAETTKSDNETTTAAEETTLSELEEKSQYFPAGDLKGATFKILKHNGGVEIDPNAEKIDEFDKADREARIAAVEKKYNCKIELVSVTGNYDDIPSEIIKSYASGQPIADLVDIDGMWLTQLVSNNVLYDMTDVIKDKPYGKKWVENATWLDKVYGVGSGMGGEGLVYNRKMIKDAGMEKTPSEMFAEGKWSYDDFYAYCSELKSKLKENEYPFFIDPLYWGLFASAANGVHVINNDGTMGYTEEPFIECMEFLQKLDNAGFIRPTNMSEDGTPDYWQTPGATFDQGQEVVMTHRGGWQMAALVDKVDFGFVPYPWGSNIEFTSDGSKEAYKALPDNYQATYYNSRVEVLIKGVENKGDPAVIMDMFLELLDKSDAVKDYNNEKAGIVEVKPSNSNFFSDDLDLELYEWMLSRERLELMQSVKPVVRIGKVFEDIINEKKPVRATLEAQAQADEAAMKDAGWVK